MTTICQDNCPLQTFNKLFYVQCVDCPILTSTYVKQSSKIRTNVNVKYVQFGSFYYYKSVFLFFKNAVEDWREHIRRKTSFNWVQLLLVSTAGGWFCNVPNDWLRSGIYEILRDVWVAARRTLFSSQRDVRQRFHYTNWRVDRDCWQQCRHRQRSTWRSLLRGSHVRTRWLPQKELDTSIGNRRY